VSTSPPSNGLDLPHLRSNGSYSYHPRPEEPQPSYLHDPQVGSRPSSTYARSDSQSVQAHRDFMAQPERPEAGDRKGRLRLGRPDLPVHLYRLLPVRTRGTRVRRSGDLTGGLGGVLPQEGERWEGNQGEEDRVVLLRLSYCMGCWKGYRKVAG
jgi:hypothetical protein